MEIAGDDREPGEQRAVRPAKRKEASFFMADSLVKILEIFGEDRGLNHAGEAVIVMLPAAADAEERRTLIGRTRRQNFADEYPAMGRDPICRSIRELGLEIVPVSEVDIWRRKFQTVDQGMAVGVEYPGRFHLRQRI